MYKSLYSEVAADRAQESHHATNSVVATQSNVSCCNVYSAYRWRWFKNKGVILVLFWSFATFCLYNHILGVYYESFDMTSGYLIVAVVVSTFLPIAGWLTDVYIGRYRVIKVSLMVQWCGTVLWCLMDALVVGSLMPHYINHILVLCISILSCLALGCFLVNVVQFCMDQLLDSSSNEIISFITWYVWTYYAAKLMTELQVCTKYEDYHFKYYVYTFSLLYISILFTLAVSSDFLFNQWLFREPVSHNPLKLIFKVLRFALNHKYPQQLSALAYWNSHRCSRIDLAKIKYGGPFTSKQVEDVKAFFRIHVLILVPIIVGSLSLYSSSQISPFLSRFQGFQEVACAEMKEFGKCLKKEFVTKFGYVIVVLYIPVYEFVLRPLFLKWIPEFKTFTRLAIGAFLVLVHLSGLMSAEVVGHFTRNETRELSNLTCMQFQHEHNLTCDPEFDQGIFYYWLSLPSTVYVVGQYLIIAAGIEYLCAKTPYSMRGLMFGSVYTYLGILMFVLHFMFFLFYRYNIMVFGVTLGCVFWFLVTCAIVALLFIVLLLLIGSRFYKKRRKVLDDTAEDDLPID